MKRFSSVVIIYNPKSTGNSKKNALKLQKQLEKSLKGMPVTTVATQYAGHAKELAYELARKRGRPLIVSSSGDGGYNEVINGVLRAKNKRATTAVLPSGNANDHSRAMHERPLLDAILAGDIHRIDVLKVIIKPPRKRKILSYAHSYVGLGMTPVVATELNAHTLNRFNEVILAVRVFFKYGAFTIIRGDKAKRYNSLIFANIRHMAKLIKFSPENTPSDGLFEVVELPHTTRWLIVKEMLKAITVGLNTTRQEKKYEFKTISDMPMQLDGEVLDVPAGSSVAIISAQKVLRTVF